MTQSFHRTCHRAPLTVSLIIASLLALTIGASAQDFPSKPVRIVVPFAAGGGTDTLAHSLAEKMSPKLGQPVLVDNKAGVGGSIGTDSVTKSAPDGYTLLLGITASMLTNTFLYQKLPYDPRKDLALISIVAVGPVVLLVHPSLPVKTAPELLKYIAANKGKLSYGSWGAGSIAHLAAAHMSATQDGDMTHVAYKGEAPMLQDLIGGQIPMAFASLTQAKQQIEAGRLRAVGVSGDARTGVLPDVPTLGEQGLTDDAYRINGWFAFAAPAGTPKPVLARISEVLVTACKEPEVKVRIEVMGFVPKCTSREEAVAMYQRELPVW